MSFFDLTDTLAGGEGRFGSALEKNGLVIQFYHIPTFKKGIENNFDNGSQASFKAFLTSFKDNFKVNWNQKETFGRMDAVQTYKNTQRQITVAFDVPSHSQEEAETNFVELQKLIMMQYPVYEVMSINSVSKPDTSKTSPQAAGGTDRDNAVNIAANSDPAVLNGDNKSTLGRFISSPPLLYIKFLNWISEGASNPSYDKTSMVDDALVGILSEVAFEPDMDQGFHFNNGKMIPKLFTVSLSITVIHTQELGWVNTVNGSNQKINNHLFGEPTAEPSQEGFEGYPTFPYKTDLFTYKK